MTEGNKAVQKSVSADIQADIYEWQAYVEKDFGPEELGPALLRVIQTARGSFESIEPDLSEKSSKEITKILNNMECTSKRLTHLNESIAEVGAWDKAAVRELWDDVLGEIDFGLGALRTWASKLDNQETPAEAAIAGSDTTSSVEDQYHTLFDELAKVRNAVEILLCNADAHRPGTLREQQKEAETKAGRLRVTADSVQLYTQHTERQQKLENESGSKVSVKDVWKSLKGEEDKVASALTWTAYDRRYRRTRDNLDDKVEPVGSVNDTKSAVRQSEI